MKQIRNLLLLFWFGWFALAGTFTTGIIAWLTPWNPSGWAIVAIGAGLGILVAAVLAIGLVWLLWRRIGAPLLRTLGALRFLRQQVFHASSRYRF
ncbi:MAG: hypothetical protein MUF62_07500 [Chitinophagaceae bacterium]|nr:hypothetical protein [Chitinophagaceae bacterium]